MTTQREKTPALQAWADLLVCPACYGSLREDESRVRCDGCGGVYPVADGVPVLISERNLAREPKP
jgi:uncharacterized protein YbaR (Trm112 family)